MRIKGILDEDFVNYKLPNMFISSAVCSFKCDKENGANVCQNSSLANQETLDISDYELVQRYLKNDITQAVCIAGLEPFDQFDELMHFVKEYRHYTKDPLVIYTGYYKYEIEDKINKLKLYQNIIIKYGRFKPNQNKHFDDVLGVFLTSDGQYAEKIS